MTPRVSITVFKRFPDLRGHVTGTQKHDTNMSTLGPNCTSIMKILTTIFETFGTAINCDKMKVVQILKLKNACSSLCAKNDCNSCQSFFPLEISFWRKKREALKKNQRFFFLLFLNVDWNETIWKQNIRHRHWRQTML